MTSSFFIMTTIEAFELVQSVLEYYASSASWELYLDGAGNHSTECDATTNDRGRRARQALKQLEVLELEPQEQSSQDVLPVAPTQEKHPTQHPTT